jgi:hypothetical protein
MTLFPYTTLFRSALIVATVRAHWSVRTSVATQIFMLWRASKFMGMSQRYFVVHWQTEIWICGILSYCCRVTAGSVINGYLSTRCGASSGCGWRIAANILNKQSRTADKGWSPSFFYSWTLFLFYYTHYLSMIHISFHFFFRVFFLLYTVDEVLTTPHLKNVWCCEPKSNAHLWLR